MSKFITIIRPDFMLFCKDACRSAALNHLLFRIAGKSKNQPKENIQAGDILWYAKTEQITEEMSNAWGVCKVRQEVNKLIGMGLVGRRSNPEWGADRTKHFSFGQEQCKVFLNYCEEHAICVVHIGLPPEVMHLIYSSNANDISIKCICAIHQMELIEASDANDKYIEAIPIDRPTIDDYKEGKTKVATSAEDRNAPAALINFAERKTESDKHKAVRVSDSHMDIGNDDEEDIGLAETTPRTPAVTKGQAHDHHPMGSNSLHDIPSQRVPDLGNAGTDRQVRPRPQEEITSQQTPAASVSLSLAVIPSGGQDDTGGRQAHLSTFSIPIIPAAPSGMSRTGNPPASPEARQAGLKIVRAPVTQEKLSLKEDAPVIRQETAAQILKRQERRRDEILALYGKEIGRKPSRSRDNLAGALLCAQDDISDEDIKTTIKEILKDPFMAKQMDMKYVYEKLDVFAGKALAAPVRDEHIGVSGLPRLYPPKREVKYG